MKVLDRYMARQLGTATFMAVAVLSVVLVLGNLFKQIFDLIINRNAPYEFLLTFVSYILPFSMTFTLPWGFLTAVLLVFGRMSAEHELTALRSCGVTMSRICLTTFGMAFFCVGICLWINLDFAPRRQAEFKEAIYDLAIKRPLAMFDTDRVIDVFQGLKIYIERNDGTQLHNLLVYEVGKDSEPQKVIFARRGQIHPDLANHRLLLEIFDARFEQRDSNDPQNFSRIRQGITLSKSTLPISLEELYVRYKKNRGLTSLTLVEMLGCLRTGNALDGVTPLADSTRLEYRVEINRRFSLSLACFAFSLVAVPLAVGAQRRETAVGFLLSLVVAFSYFLIMIMVGWVKNRPEWHPEWLIWLPTLLFLALGGRMFRRLAAR
jgi:lipopolysaccharide export LptBFGC system permease protein LptF